MSRRPRSSGGRAGRGGGRGGGGVAPPALEVPLQIPGLMAWFDSRSLPHLVFSSGNSISGWLSRAGTLGAIPWSQGTFANQPVLVSAEPTFNNQPAVLFDGVDDNFVTTNQNAWKFLHDGTGCSTFRVLRIDSTGVASMRPLANSSAGTGPIGILQQLSTTTFTAQISNGTGTVVNTLSTTTAAHWVRDVSRWHMWGHGSAIAHSRVSGSSVTSADTGGPPSAANPAAPIRLGSNSAGTANFKGWIPQELYYDHVLAAGELASLATYFAPIYGIAP